MKWIDLKDKTSGARLKSGPINGSNFLWIVGLPHSSPRWQQAIDKLGFTASPNRKFLIRPVRPEDKNLTATSLHPVWPDAAYADMEPDKVLLNLNRTPATAKDRTEEERELNAEIGNARRLGRNADGDEVYQSAAGRFIYREQSGITRETPSLRPAMFLYARDDESLDLCADGFVKSMLKGEVQRGDDFMRFLAAVTTTPGQALRAKFEAGEIDRTHEAIDAAVSRFLSVEHDTPNDAYGDANRLYEYLPPYQGTPRGKGAMPIPLSIIAQRLLGDTTGKTVVLPNAFDGAAFSFLADGTSIRAFKGNRDLSARAKGLQRDGLVWLDEFHHARESNADAMFFNADPVFTADGARLDYRDALLAVRSLAPDGRAVLVLAGDKVDRPGELSMQGRTFIEKLCLHYEIEDAFDIGRELTQRVGTDTPLRVIALRNRAPKHGTQPPPAVLPACHSWDEIKTRVDESLARAAIKELESEGIDLEKVAEENRLQRPYIAFSKVGEATTMVPKELQAPLQAFMSELEAQVGPVDRFVEGEIGFGENTLSHHFSPEQVDAVGMMISRMRRGRGHILGDETGIGKGRSLAALAVWALKQDRPVVFVTDRANLFSDLARDLRDIGEWGRVQPFIMNADGRIEDNVGEAGVLAEGTKVGEMRRVLDSNVPLRDLGANLVFCTYSQISGAESDKALWLKNQLRNALLIVDEAHIAAGSDSNIATQIAEMTQLAWAVQYSSATWAKSAENLHIFARAFPESVNVATLAQTMRRGGEAFSEVFSSMLAREGALIRREHDLSKLEFVVEVDQENAVRNSAIADQVSEIMGAMAYTSGDLRRLVTRLSDLNIATLREAREARNSAAKTSIFKSRFGTGSMLYQVHRRVNAALNADNAIRLALEGIEAGRKPVIVFEDTGEAFVRQALERQAEFDPSGRPIVPDLVRPPTIKDLMLRMMDSLQLVKVEEVGVADLPDLESDDEAEGEGDDEPTEATTAQAEGGAEAPQPVATGTAAGATTVPVDGGVDVLQVAEAAGQATEATNGPGMRLRKARRKFKMVPFWELENVSGNDRERFKSGVAEIIRRIEAMPEIPLNAPDEIARRLGERGVRVGELSGRSFSLQPSDIPGMCRVVPRPKNKAHVNATVRAFNNGQLDALQINRSAATGISLHASPRFADRRRRQLIEMQIPENPTDRIQLYGRVNRFDQESFPLIQVASTGIYGEVRQIMVQNKKLAEMSANVRSSRDSHALIRGIPDLLNVLGREVCRTFLEENPEVLSRLDIDPQTVEDGSRDFSHLLTSRVPLLRTDEQKQVYEQLYALFEDAVLEAELAGANPLKPNELDVRATMSERRLMFGFDHQGLGSAFDGAVFAQRLDWAEDVRPLSLEAILGVIKANRDKLLDGGRATKKGDRPSGVPDIDLADLSKRVAAQLDARVRLAMANPEMRQFRTVDDALAEARKAGGKPTPTLRSMLKTQARARWIERHLPKLVPGRIISMPRGPNVFAGDRTAIILDIVPPPDKRESQLVRWRVLTIAPGEARARSTTLNALIGNIVSAADVERQVTASRSAEPAPEQPVRQAEYFSTRVRIGSDFLDLVEAPEDERRTMRGSWFYDDFKMPFVGVRKRKALVLTGNMYLASEWASQTKAGQGVIFSDERGLRHRGVLLQDKFKPEWLRYLPVRLWTTPMIHAFVDRLLSGDLDQCRHAGGFRVHTSFDTAWKATQESSSAGEPGSLRIVSDTGIVMNVGTKSRNRVNGMLRQAQKAIKDKLFDGRKVRPAEDPGHVVVKVPTRGRKEAGYVVLHAPTPEQMHRAIDMLIKGPGLELFVSADSQLGRAARQCMRDFFVQQLRSGAAMDAARTAKLEEFLAREQAADDAVADVDTEDERELRALFAAVGTRESAGDHAGRKSAQQDFDFEGGAIPVEEEPEEPQSADPAAASAAIDINGLFAGGRRAAGRAPGAVDEPGADPEQGDEQARSRDDRMVA